MPVIPSELGVGSLERGVSVGLGLLDTEVAHTLACEIPMAPRDHRIAMA